MKTDIEKLEKLEKAATPGKWEHYQGARGDKGMTEKEKSFVDRWLEFWDQYKKEHGLPEEYGRVKK